MMMNGCFRKIYMSHSYTRVPVKMVDEMGETYIAIVEHYCCAS